jgi:zinc/manganese transport system substrate-binding protein
MAMLAVALIFTATLAAAQTAEKVKVLASFSILGDLVRQVGGEHVDVDLLVGPNVDMHSFQPSPADSRKLSGAKLVVINGLGLEGWADRLVKAAGYRGARLVASKGVKALSGHEHGHGEGGHGRYDPHAWQDVRNVKIYVIYQHPRCADRGRSRQQGGVSTERGRLSRSPRRARPRHPRVLRRHSERTPAGDHHA